MSSVSLILNYITAYQMLHRSAKVKSGQRVLFHGASGGVGTALLQLGPREDSGVCRPTHLLLLHSQNGARVSLLIYAVPPAAATSKVVIRLVAFPVLLVVSALLRGFYGTRHLRSFCFALALFRFWLAVPVPQKSSF